MEKSVHEELAEFERHLQQGVNPADIIGILETAGKLPADLVVSLLHHALVKSDAYRCTSINLPQSPPAWQDLLAAASSIPGFDSVIAYHESEENLRLINPRAPDHSIVTRPLLPGSLVVIYARSVPRRDPDSEKMFLARLRSLLSSPIGPPENREREDSPLPLRKSPRYAVQVTNEFFHHGNVEAWQNIIAHYLEKHPESKIHIFHDNRPVHRISKLFEWGRVSVGDVIHFTVTASDFRTVAKLKKYLSMGASPRYLPFIKKHRYDHLNLF